MASKFHINPDSGAVSRCHAEKGGCPFGGESGTENHFDTIAEARKGYEVLRHKDTLNSHKAISKSAAKKPSKKETKTETLFPEAEPATVDDKYGVLSEESAKLREAKHAAYDKWREIGKGLKYSKTMDTTTQEWYDKVQARKYAYYDMLKAQKDFEESLSPEAQKKLSEENEAKRLADLEGFEQWKRNKEAKEGPYNFHPDITTSNYKEAFAPLQAFSGLSEEELKDKVKARIAKGESMTDAVRNIWSEMPLRNDKPIVSLDLESAAPLVNNRVDGGPYSCIIEVGYVVRQPNGETRKESYLCGVPESLMETTGTGAEDIHHITPEMVKDLKPFDADSEKQQKLLNDLTGSVLLVHNAKYETNVFKHNLPGFNEAFAKGAIEVLDTKEVCRWYCPETEVNTNEAFVNATGGEYVGAHRAYQDAQMSTNALFRMKGIEEIDL